ncbi:hypothetical protein GOBAR_DD12339 [Gossypium barbadense]|nr:hypothetical protein GOBAR_DD12339 [Gossypium barbadense]
MQNGKSMRVPQYHPRHLKIFEKGATQLNIQKNIIAFLALQTTHSNPEGSSVEKSKNPGSLNIGSVEIPTTNIRTIVSACAKAFKDRYFPSELGAVEVGRTEELLHLKLFCMKLNAGVGDQKDNIFSV